jgi:hypothetical protein
MMPKASKTLTRMICVWKSRLRRPFAANPEEQFNYQESFQNACYGGFLKYREERRILSSFGLHGEEWRLPSMAQTQGCVIRRRPPVNRKKYEQ